MAEVFKDNTVFIEKSQLCHCKRYSMLLLILAVLCIIPFKMSSFSQMISILLIWLFSNIMICTEGGTLARAKDSIIM